MVTGEMSKLEFGNCTTGSNVIAENLEGSVTFFSITHYFGKVGGVVPCTSTDVL